MTAALIVIGNEILSGKITDTNSAFLARQLRAAGVTLRRMVVLPDDQAEIAEAVRKYHPTYQVVFTSGGVGPTHDDVTIAGVAEGLGRSVVRHPVLEELVRRYFDREVGESELRMAEVVDGTELIFEPGTRFPVFRVENLYLLPGIPELFEEMVSALMPRFCVAPFFLRAVYVDEPESKIAACLNRLLEAFPLLLLGSYPTLSDPAYRVKVTLESKDKAYLESALASLLGSLSGERVVRVD